MRSEIHKHNACDMRGFLSFLVLWLLSKKSMTGAELADEIEKRKGCRPNPGTIYPALRELVRKKAIKISLKEEKEKSYVLTELGKEELKEATNVFCKTFYDIFSR